MRKLLSLLMVLGLQASLLMAQSDSLGLAYGDFLGLVLENHPLARQAALKPATGSAYLQAARGAFDPYLSANLDAKDFGGKSYWNRFQTQLKVPTWMGLEVFAGTQAATGYYLNPDETLPQGGQAVAGIEWNVGRGLLIDQRRAELAKAKAYLLMTGLQKRKMELDLVVEASNSYWTWVLAYQNLRTFETALELAQVRFEGIRSNYQRGENPAIDTLEAFIQVQTRQFNLSEAQAELAKATRSLNNFLWNPEGQPVEFDENIRPAENAKVINRLSGLPDQVIDSLIAAHPDLLYYEAQGTRLELDRRLQAEQLKPEISLKYQALTGSIQDRQLLGSLDPLSNVKYGFKFSFPLFLRKQRGYLNLSKIAIQENDLQTAQKRLEITNKIGALQSQIDAVENQITVYENMVKNYQRMVEAEMEKFMLGESSIFLVNSREQKLIESQLKLNQLQSKLPMLVAEANRATGGYLLD